MDQRLADLLQKTSLYGTLAMYYEHSDPKLHMYFYQVHIKYENQLVEHYWMLRKQNPNMDNK
ncbi:hypothetical protein SAMN05518871_103473 [Psychrobacillus sp. OK028]|uniref:hypothetical protein n=1 Tax=Psychrobacillus sp. OK028 TaxID=1884359 RepID=UPI000891E9E7|nr:hypothetical protein [Psychrobacillus sp. OK028]SDN16213.1 hypothetical protein SAMN05518871_103473 [Psychrobacillus sp. OK028]